MGFESRDADAGREGRCAKLSCDIQSVLDRVSARLAQKGNIAWVIRPKTLPHVWRPKIFRTEVLNSETCLDRKAQRTQRCLSRSVPVKHPVSSNNGK